MRALVVIYLCSESFAASSLSTKFKLLAKTIKALDGLSKLTRSLGFTAIFIYQLVPECIRDSMTTLPLCWCSLYLDDYSFSLQKWQNPLNLNSSTSVKLLYGWINLSSWFIFLTRREEREIGATPGKKRYLAQSLALRKASKLTLDDESNSHLLSTCNIPGTVLYTHCFI